MVSMLSISRQPSHDVITVTLTRGGSRRGSLGEVGLGGHVPPMPPWLAMGKNMELVIFFSFLFHTQMSWYDESHYTEKGIRSMNMLI